MPLLEPRIISADRAALPTAMTLPCDSMGASPATRTLSPHHSTCLQKTDLPRSTNGAASASTSMQFSLNLLLLISISAQYGVSASPPSTLSVQRSLPSCMAVLILPVFLETVSSISLGRYLDTPFPNNASNV